MCSNSKSINKDNIDSLTDADLMDAFEDIYLFSCSFVDKSKQTDKNAPILWSSIDFETFKKFHKRVTDHCKTDNQEDALFAEKLDDLLEVFDHEISRGIDGSVEFIQSAIRGFILLLLMPEMDEFPYF